MKCVPLVATLAALSTTVVAQQTQTVIGITANGIERGSFIPRDTPYTQGGPAVGVYLVDRRDIRTSDGLVVTGFEFIGWTEGDATRVQVFALVPRKGAPNTYMPNGNPDLLERRDFASYRILSDQGIGIQEMRSLGLEPMILSSRQVVPGLLAAQLERARQAAEALRSAKP